MDERKVPTIRYLPGSGPAAGAVTVTRLRAVSTSLTNKKPATLALRTWSGVGACDTANRHCICSIEGARFCSRRGSARETAPAGSMVLGTRGPLPMQARV